MYLLSTPRLIISGAAPQCGKSLLVMALTVALKSRKVSVSCCVNAPSLYFSAIYQRLARRYVRCLDHRILSSKQIMQSVCQASLGADLILIDGTRGLYDGSSPGSLRGSDAELAAIAHIPVVLTVDVRGFGQSLAALVKGYQELAQNFKVCGVIANRVDVGDAFESRDATFYNAALDYFGQDRLLGAAPELSPSPDLPPSELRASGVNISLDRQFIVDLGQLASNHIDLERLQELAASAEPTRINGIEIEPRGRRCRIAVSDDSCFNVCFQDNLDLLRYYGAEIVAFSPLADESIPERSGAVYLSGGNLQDYGRELYNNQSMYQALRKFHEAGGVIYAEGSGAAYLCDQFILGEDGSSVDGVGILEGQAMPGPAMMHYTDAATVEDSIIGRPGQVIKGYAVGEWSIEPKRRTLAILRATQLGVETDADGFSPGPQIIMCRHYYHFGSNPEIARALVDAAEVNHKLS